MISGKYINDGKPYWDMNFKSIEAANKIKILINQSKWSKFKRYCPICYENEVLETLSEKNKYGLGQHIVICKRCGMIFCEDAIDQDATNDFYKNYYIDLCTGGASLNYIYEYQLNRGISVLSYLRNFNLNNPKNILEIGCGTGGISKVISDSYSSAKYYGLDYRSEDIEIAKKNGIHVFEYSDDIYEKISKIKFDLIVAYHVVEHFVDINHELKKIKSIMDDETLLFIGVPGMLNTYHDYNIFLETFSTDHNYYFTAVTLKNLLTNLGFDIVHIDEKINCMCKINKKNEVANVNSDYNRIMQYIIDNEPKFYMLYNCKLFFRKLKKIIKRFLSVE